MAKSYELAHLAWPLLTAAAQAGQVLTYKELATQLGYKAARPMRYALLPIQDLCIEKGWPPLTSLVVNQATQRPGSGFIASSGDLTKDREAVYSFPWDTVPAPFPPEHRKHLVQETKNLTDPLSFAVPDIASHLNGRGPYQTRFRKILVGAYGARCALCESILGTILVASHIVPWSEDTKNRLNPRNGLLLCRTHDALFEAGIVRVDVDLSVSWPSATKAKLGKDLYQFLIHHTQEQIRVPRKPNRPDPKFLQWRLHNSPQAP